MSTPGFRALRTAFPKAQIVALTPEPLAPILAGSPDLDEVWTFSSRGLRATREVARRISEREFDLGIVIPESISSAFMMRLGRVRHVTGFYRDGLRRILLHKAEVAPAEWGRRRLVSKERFVLALMQSVGATEADTRLSLKVTEDESTRLAKVLTRHVLNGSPSSLQPPVVLAPGASFGESKCWPVESYAALADELIRRGESVVLIGTAAERARTRKVREAMHSSVIDLAGELDLGMLKAMLSSAKLLVANDAGARHVAAAFRVPSIVFFGPTSVAKTNENLRNVKILETEHGCRPCYRRTCPIDHRCLTSIGVEEALTAVDHALNSSANCWRDSAGRIAKRGIGLA